MGEVKGILCPTDFSEPSERALRYAGVLATHLGARLMIAHVLDPAKCGSEPELAATHRLAPLGGQLEQAGLAVDRQVLRGVAHEVISRVASRAEVDLVCMGTHARTGLSHAVIGSVTERVIRSCTKPVLTLSQSAGEEVLRRAPRTILCPVDLSPSSYQAGRAAVELAAQLGGGVRVVLLHAHAPPLVTVGNVPEQPHSAEPLSALSALDELRTSLEAPDVEVALTEGSALEAILAHAQSERADLIVMATRPRSGVERWIAGSVTERVIRRGEVPVLVVR